MSSPGSNLVDGWSGPMRSYDLLKEAAVALTLVTIAAVALALTFGTPRRDAITFQEWATADPIDLATTTLSELDGTSGTATSGPPYTSDGANSQVVLGISPARIAGVSIPIDTAEDLVLAPLSTLGPADAELGNAIDQFRAASQAEVATWADRYRTALDSATVSDGEIVVSPGDSGPLDTLVQAVVTHAREGAFTGPLVDHQAQRPPYYTLDTTRSGLFLSDGGFLDRTADEQGLGGSQWGAMNTLGNWPGQWWLGLFSLWYQFPPGSTSANADLLVAAVMGAITLAVVFLPWIPGLRSLPARTRFDRVVWRRIEQ